MQYVEKIHVTADARTQKSRDPYIPANGATVAYYKKTSISELDEMNKALQSHIRVAYRLGYLKGKSSRSEWEGRSAEIGRMIGKYKEWVYGDQKSSQQNKSAKSRYSR